MSSFGACRGIVAGLLQKGESSVKDTGRGHERPPKALDVALAGLAGGGGFQWRSIVKRGYPKIILVDDVFSPHLATIRNASKS